MTDLTAAIKEVDSRIDAGMQTPHGPDIPQIITDVANEQDIERAELSAALQREWSAPIG